MNAWRNPTIRPCCEALYPDHLKTCWTRDPSALPWHSGWLAEWFSKSPFPTRRCRASVGDIPHGGRCQLREHEPWIDHAIRECDERPEGPEGRTWIYRWTSVWTSQRDLTAEEKRGNQ
jgi:hypothetical protein